VIFASNPQVNVRRNSVHRTKLINNTALHQLKVMFSNVDTLTNKHQELLSYIVLEKPHIVAICEFFSKFEVDDYVPDIPNYDKLMPAQRGDRGVVIYAHRDIQASLVTRFDTVGFEEAIWCSMKLDKGDNLLFGCIYRSPSSTSENNNKLNTLLGEACSAGFSHTLIVGDFNYKEICWRENMVESHDQHPAYIFFDCDKTIICTNMWMSTPDTEPTRNRVYWI
jgi:hypothetical protein